MSFLYPNVLIQVLCKAPIPGQVKTRLMPDLSAEQAARIHQQLTRRTLELVTSSNLCPVQLWCSPDTTHSFFKQMKDDYALALLPQSPGDLGQRMYTALSSGSKTSDHMILLGCDCPSLNKEDLAYAIKALITIYDTVLAPAEDGGYCLIGMNTPQAELFNHIVWGSNEVLNKTREKILKLKLNCLELDTQWDVDNYADYLKYLDFFQENNP